MNDKIRGLVAYYKRKYNTNDPFEIADHLGILYQFCEIDFEGCYMFLKNHRYIFLNRLLKDKGKLIVMAHELGHAILHRKNNCYFIKGKTLLLNHKTEKEANMFAAELLIEDQIIKDNHTLTLSQLSRLLGYEEKFIELKLKLMKSI